MTDVLSAVAGELVLAQTTCARLDGALGQLLDGAAAEQRGAVMRELHVVDLLNQQIAAVAGFVDRLSNGVGQGVTVEVREALGSITLGEVAQRISLSVGQVAAVSQAVSEDVDFF
jgi:DNA-binding FrmR family transcriptional regulator